MPPKNKAKSANGAPKKAPVTKKPPQRKAAKPTVTNKVTPKKKASAKQKAPSPEKSSKSSSRSSDESSSQEEEESVFAHGSESYEFSERDEDETASLHSDNLDEELEDIRPKSPSASPVKPKKRKRGSEAGSTKSTPVKKAKTSPSKKSPQKKRKSKLDEYELGDESEDEDEESVELEDGQEVVGRVIQAPKTGRVPPGQISQNTLNFLAELKKPECNDREWFKLHEPVYRLAEQEWKDFIEEFTTVLTEVDAQIPHLPPKDVSHRIYRDVRFSNDKTPYKTGFSASFSRSGRKGIFAGYHVVIKSGNQSLIAAGSWQPGKNEIAMIRNNILRNPRRLRNIISAPAFVELFGEAKRHPKGERQNIFGMEDELKVAPKGFDKNHKDIDLLKCRSFAVFHHFTDEEVLQEDFKDELARIAGIVRPFVHCLNDMMTIPNDADEEGGEDEHEDEEGDGEDEDGDEEGDEEP